MKKFLLVAGALTVASAIFLQSNMEKKMSQKTHEIPAPGKESGTVIAFPRDRAQMTVPELVQLEEKYEAFSPEELKKESVRLDELLNSSGLIESANNSRLGITDQKKILHYMRAKAVVSVKLLEIQSEEI